MNSTNGETFWPLLNEITGLIKKLEKKKIQKEDLLNEEGFHLFVKNIVTKNPRLFGVDKHSPLYDGKELELFKDNQF